MVEFTQWRLASVIALPFALAPGSSSQAVCARNATITANVNLRKSYPTYGVSTLFRFRLTPGPTLAVIPKDARVCVSTRKVVAKQEWFEATYAQDAAELTGWIYAGDVGDRRYLQLDPGAEHSLRIAAHGSRAPGTPLPATLMIILPGVDQAQPLQAAQEEPPVPTKPFATMVLAAGYLVIFIAALYVVKKWVFSGSNTYTFLTSLCVLLILGFISQNTLQDLLGAALAK